MSNQNDLLGQSNRLRWARHRENKVNDLIALALLAAFVFSAVAMIFGCAPAHAFDPWSEADKHRQGAFNVALALDWRQTLQIIKDPNRYETNVILGKYPSTLRCRCSGMLP